MSKQQDQFLKIPYKILRATGYVSKAGEEVKMNLSDKIIYCHIKNRFEFFTRLGKEYFDTQQAIADVCSMDLKATGNILRKFIKHDVTGIYKKPYNNYLKNVYLSVDHLTLYSKDKNGKVVVHKTSTEDYDYGEMPADFIVDLPDIGYSKESEIDMNSLDIEWEY